MLSRTLVRCSFQQQKLPLFYFTKSRLTPLPALSHPSEPFKEVTHFFTHLESIPAPDHSGAATTDVKTMFHFSKKDRNRSRKRQQQQQKELKRKAFSGLLQWCQAHQSEDHTSSSSSWPAAAIEADQAALDWLRKNISSFTCGQCLVVCSLLCDIIGRADRREPLPAQPSRSESGDPEEDAAEAFFTDAYAVIALLVRQIEASEALETQTHFPLLLSALYGLFRASRTDFVAQRPTHLDLIRAPQMLWFALLNSLRTTLETQASSSAEVAAGAEGEETQTSPGAALTVDQMLTFFLLFDAEKQRELLSVREQKRMFQSIFSCLLQRIKPELRSEAELCRRVAEEEKVVQDSAAEDGAAEQTTQTRDVLAVGDCVTVMQNIAIGAAEVRLAVLQYMLFNLQSPHDLREEEHVLLPMLFATIDSIPVEQRLWLTDTVVRGLGTTSIAATVLLLPFVRDPTSLLAGREEELHRQVVANMTPEQAASLLSSVGTLVSEPIHTALLRKCLASYPVLLQEYELLFDATEPDASVLTDRIAFSDNGDTSNAELAGADGEDEHSGAAKERKASENTGSSALAASTRERSLELNSTTFFLMCFFLYNPKRTGITESSASLVMASGIAGRLRWFDRELDEAMHSLAACKASAGAIDGYAFPFRRLKVFLDSVEALGLTDLKQEGTEDLLFDVLVRPLFHADASADDDAIQLLVSVLEGGYLTKSENQKTLLERLFLFNGWHSAASARRFFQYIAPLALRYRVYPKEATKMLAKLKSLDLQGRGAGTDSGVPTPADLLCCHTQLLTRALQYTLRTPEWSEGGERAEKMRQTAGLWLDDYFQKLSQYHNASAVSGLSPDEGDGALGTGAPLTPTEADLEVLLGAALEMGCKFPSTAYSVLNQRVRVMVNPSLIERDARAGVEAEGLEPNVVPEPWLPKPAHFIVLTRGEMPLPAELTPALLEQLLTTCPLSIFANVLSTFLLRRKREGAKVLSEDLRLCEMALATLLERPEYGDPLLNGGISAAALHTCQNALSHLSRMARYMRLFALCAAPPAGPLQGKGTGVWAEEPKGWVEPGEDAIDSSPAADGTSAVILEDHVPPEKEESEAELDALRLSIQHCQDKWLKVIDLLTKKDVKELALSHLEKLSMCFPMAAKTLFARLEPQLVHFTQQELLRVASLYHEGAEVILGLLLKHDIHLTVDVGQYLALSKKLPMLLNTVIIEHHLPHLSFPWVVRVLSSLAPRHTEVPTALLTKLLDRACRAAEQSTTDSDRNFLLVVLQNYLFVEAKEQPPRHRHTPSFDAVDGKHSSPRPVRTLSHEELEVRRRLIGDCCKTVLRVDRITTLDEFVAFLDAFPGSLQEMTQSSIVKQANERILVKLLKDLPATKHQLVELLQAMKRHDILFASTTSTTYKFYFAVAQYWADKPNIFTPSLAAAVRDDIRLALLLGESRTKRRAALKQMAAALGVVQHYYEAMSARLLMLQEFTQLMAARSASGAPHRSPSFQLNRFSSPGLESVGADRLAAQRERLVDTFVDELCVALLVGGAALRSVDFAHYLQCMSRLKKWGLLVHGEDTDRLNSFDALFRSFFREADAHNRCVMLKALATSPPHLARHESFVTEVIEKDIALLSHEDIEMVLSTVLKMTLPDAVESLMDAIGTRLLPLLSQCRRSTLVRLLQCYAQFELNDDALVQGAVHLLEEQCVEGNRGLDVPQVLTLLTAVDRLHLAEPPEKLLCYGFGEIERHVESLSLHHLAQAAQLALRLEMGYSASLHTIVSRFLENRDINHHAWMKDVADDICDAYAVEVPPHLVLPKLRKRREQERRKEFWEMRRQLTALDTNV